MQNKITKSRVSRKKNEVREHVDIRAVARLANVSVSTVSRTLSGIVNVDLKMANRVWKVVNDSGYMPNKQARALASGRSKIFGIIISNLNNPFFPELIQGFEDVAVERGYEILVGSTHYDKDCMVQCIRRMIERNVDGVAIMTSGIDDLSIDQLKKRDIPLVFVDTKVNHERASVLQCDYGHGIRQGVQHLAILGHRNIAFVSGPSELNSAKLRLTAFSRSLVECGIHNKSAWIIPGNHTFEGGIVAMKRLFAIGDLPTAIMCSNDMTAIGVLHALLQQGLRVPADMSILGFDDIDPARTTIPPLTTIEMPRIELARAAIDALGGHSHGIQWAKDRQNATIRTTLVVRKSTGFPRGAMSDLLLG
jgi:DNA-binding LacI/PurR family transcriptional regulator